MRTREQFGVPRNRLGDAMHALGVVDIHAERQVDRVHVRAEAILTIWTRSCMRLAKSAIVFLHEYFDALEIYEADRQESIAPLSTPGSRARNERGALAVSKFKSIGHELDRHSRWYCQVSVRRASRYSGS